MRNVNFDIAQSRSVPREVAEPSRRARRDAPYLS
jgi:hypothetical protein